MKKLVLVPVILMLLLILTSCFGTPNLTVTTKNTDSPTVTMLKAGKSAFYYQGFVEVDVSGATGISDIQIKNIKFADNKNGIPTLQKAGKAYLQPNDIKNVETEVTAGTKFDTYGFSGADIIPKGKITAIKLQYLILAVSPDVKKEDIKRKATMTLVCQNSKGGKIASTNVEITIP